MFLWDNCRTKYAWYKDAESETVIEEIEIRASVKQSPDEPHVEDADEDPQEDGGHQDEDFRGWTLM